MSCYSFIIRNCYLWFVFISYTNSLILIILQLPHTEEAFTEHHLQVTAATDAAYDGDHRLTIDMRTAKRNNFNPLWSDIKLPSATVGYICVSINAKPYCFVLFDRSGCVKNIVNLVYEL